MTTHRRSSREPSVPRAFRAHSTRAVVRAKTPVKKKTYKSVFEQVTAPKKKLRWNETCGHPPPGYTFVPYGSPTLTDYCREVCTRRNAGVYIVKAQPHSASGTDPTRVSNYTHRVGHHFPTDVVAQAVDALDLVIRNGMYVERASIRTKGLAPRHSDYYNVGKQRTVETEEELAAAIRESFPKIPEPDVRAIVKHAFNKGTSRVGTASDLTLSRRVQLAVSAHIRHVYTDYDKLLKLRTYFDARAEVEPHTIAMMKKWRDEDDHGLEMEETFREYIVIDDDEEDAQSSDTGEDAEELQLVATHRPARELEDDDLEDVRWLHNPGNLGHDAAAQAGRNIYPPTGHSGVYGRAPTTQHQPHLPPPSRRERPALPHDGRLGNCVRSYLPEPRTREVREEPHSPHVSTSGARGRPYLPHAGSLGVRAQSYFPTGGAQVSRTRQMVEHEGTVYKLTPVDEVDSAERYNHPLVTAPRRTYREYASPPRGVYMSDQVPVYPAGRQNPRPIPEEDVVLPSIERDIIPDDRQIETIDLTTPQKRTGNRHF